MADERWEPDLFNSEAYVALHAHRFDGPGVRCAGPGRAFHAAAAGSGRFASPGRGPYGGFDVAEAVDDEGYDAFVAGAESALHRAGGRTIEVALPPLCHGQRHPHRLVALCRRGFRVVRQELNQAIPIGPRSFADQATQGTRKRIGKAVRAGVRAERLPRPEHRAGYDAIVDNRRKKGRCMSMPWSDVEAMEAAFPARTHLFGAWHAGGLVAAALCVTVNPRILYVHAWGETEGAEALSPVSLLAAEVYAFAQASGATLLDLGTSSVHGIVDPGLAGFKRSLGAAPSLKLWLSKALA